jgi:GTPase SAR1 family protein
MENISSTKEKIKQKGPLIKIALVGDSEVGKTTIINAFIVKLIFY